jgi:hypothetical protein
MLVIQNEEFLFVQTNVFTYLREDYLCEGTAWSQYWDDFDKACEYWITLLVLLLI